MKKSIFLSLAVIFLILFNLISCSQKLKTQTVEIEQAVSNQKFIVIDAMKSKRSEDLTKYGLERLTLIYTGPMWPGTKTSRERADVPKKEVIETLSRNTLPNSLPLVTFDIEHWPLDIRKKVFKDADDILSGDTILISKNVEKMVQILKWGKSANPSAKFGYYGCVPIRDYFTPVKNDPAKVKEWQAANDILQPLADECDMLFPSLYTFYNDKEQWIKYAKGNIAEARRIAKGKPIYVYVWPRYHGSNKELKDQYIDGEFWRLQLETIYNEGVQGVAIWDGSTYIWEPEKEWWKETLAFMKSKGISPK